jgi:dihydroflavonol-4-reductase
MTQTLVTGATGLVGHNVATALLERGRGVRAAVRNLDRARSVLPAEVEIVEADVCDEQAVRAAMAGCSRVFHCAGLPEQWLPDPDTFQQVNVGGTRNMIAAALDEGVERFVYTSTIDVFAAARGAEYDESMLDEEPKGTYYERSKQDADRLVVAALAEGLPAVFTHPAAVYGPGPAASPGLNDFFARLRDGKVPGLLPGGMPVVHAGDLALGHLAAEDCDPGSRFIFSDRYFTIQDMAAVVLAQCGDGNSRIPMTLPGWLASLVSACGETLAKVRKKPPLIPRGQLTFMRWGARPRSDRAREFLSWQVTPFEEGVRQTLASLE